jgi:hypothetical protein
MNKFIVATFLDSEGFWMNFTKYKNILFEANLVSDEDLLFKLILPCSFLRGFISVSCFEDVIAVKQS